MKPDPDMAQCSMNQPLVTMIKVEKYNFFKNYTYLITDKNSADAVLVDPAWQLDKIADQLKRSNAALKGIVLTHSHFDHTNLANQLCTDFGCDVYINRKEHEFYDFRCKRLQYFEPNATLPIGALSIKTWHTPGHTAGGTCYQIANHLFTGDTLFIEGCGICWGNGANPVDMFYSLNRLKHAVSFDSLIYPGHSYGKTPGISFNRLIENNIYMNISDLKIFTDFRMRKNQMSLFKFH